MKNVDLGKPTSFLDHVSLGCTQRECQASMDIVDIFRSMFESRICAGAMEKNTRSFSSGETRAKTLSLHGPMIWKVMQRNAWKDIAN